MRLCYCGNETKMLRCGTNSFSCGNVCNSLMDCGHRCKEACHEGRCPPCNLSSVRSCNCGKSKEKEVKCGEEFRCTEKCNNKLSCGIHRCEKVCHKKGECDKCIPQKECFCGRTKYPDLKCDETPPKCMNVCGKKLSCGKDWGSWINCLLSFFRSFLWQSLSRWWMSSLFNVHSREKM